ncbi:MAG: DUF2993 domain-containing protein [Synergistota bacterium]|jgi:hypothetical protein|nr:DUF2993 domain-containing protein [Synergistota bacterium]OPZ40913.1 MAG: hypothetical protein BWY99_00292 [Synergistetes bacterium ADurb.BinA166]
MYVAPDSTGGRFTHCLRALTLALVLLAASPFPASSAEGSETNGERLVRFFVDEFHPETMSMIIENEPEDDGLVREMFLDVTGCDIGGVRIDSLKLRAVGVSFTPPSEWEREPPDIREILNVHAFARITESDLNKNLLEKQFGDDDEWHNLQVRISPDGIYARGNYHVRVLFTLDILIEIFSKFKIVDMQQVWLDDYTLRVNRVDVPGFITDKAISQIQPLLDLGKFVFPLRLSSIVFEQGSMTIASRVIPEPFEGIVYEYTRDAEDVE